MFKDPLSKQETPKKLEQEKSSKQKEVEKPFINDDEGLEFIK